MELGSAASCRGLEEPWRTRTGGNTSGWSLALGNVAASVFPGMSSGRHPNRWASRNSRGADRNERNDYDFEQTSASKVPTIMFVDESKRDGT